MQQVFAGGAEWTRSTDVLRDDKTTAGPQEARCLAVEGGLVRRVTEAFERPDNIEACIGKACVGVVDLCKGNTSRPPGACREALCLDHLTIYWCYSNHGGTTLLCEPKT